MKRTKVLVMASAVFFLANAANAETTKPTDSVKPIERQDGTLDFQKLSDRKLNEFIAIQTFLLNRQISALNSALLMSMTTTKSLNLNESKTMLSTVFEISKVSARTIEGWLPDDPRARKLWNRCFRQTRRRPGKTRRAASHGDEAAFSSWRYPVPPQGVLLSLKLHKVADDGTLNDAVCAISNALRHGVDAL